MNFVEERSHTFIAALQALQDTGGPYYSPEIDAATPRAETLPTDGCRYFLARSGRSGYGIDRAGVVTLSFIAKS